jgi:hypothetical protein
MPLPKISTPTYELELPSTGQSIEYRPFLVREEKLLVIAMESEDTKQITNAIKTVIKSCIQTKNIKVETLPTFDIEFLFLNIRGKSVGEDIEVNIICPDDNETTVPVKINLDEIQVQKNEDHTNKIKLDKYHKYSLWEIENMIPWERDVYVGLLQQHLEEEELKQNQQMSNARF